MEPRRGWRDIDSPNVRRIAEVFESVLKLTPHHVGACHLYIHLTEATTQPGKAEECADAIGNAVPGASHLNHMPSHTWNQLGRWGDSVRANLDAVHSDQKAAFGEGFAIYPPHNQHMLMYAASFDGQGAIAMQAGRDYGKLARSRMYQVLTLVRFGRFDEVLELTGRPTDDIESGVWDFGQGYAQLRHGDKVAARENLKRLQQTAASSSQTFRVHTAKNLLSTLAGILEGEIYRSEGDLPKAIECFERGVASENAMIYDEPEALPFSARHWLGAALLESKRYADAERGLSRGTQEAPAQWMVADRVARGPRGPREARGRCRERFPAELGPLGHVDPVVAILSARSTDFSLSRRVGLWPARAKPGNGLYNGIECVFPYF